MCVCNVLYVLVFGQIVVVFRICLINTQTALELVLVKRRSLRVPSGTATRYNRNNAL
jgi:hypothetical protein